MWISLSLLESWVVLLGFFLYLILRHFWGKYNVYASFTLSQVERLLLHVTMSLKPVVCWNVTQRPLAAKEARSVTRNQLQLYAALLPSCTFNLKNKLFKEILLPIHLNIPLLDQIFSNASWYSYMASHWSHQLSLTNASRPHHPF